MQLELPFLVEPPPGGAGRLRHVHLGDRLVPYLFRRGRRRTIGIVVDERGLSAAAPRWTSIAEVEAFIREKERWVLRRLAETHRHARRPFPWQEGARLPYLGGELAIARSRDGATARDGARLAVAPGAFASAAELRRHVLDWLQRSALGLFVERVAHFAPAVAVAVPRIGLSNAASQWGSCAAGPEGRARILLHWKLVHFELALVDYVVAHELAHLRHMNHSAAFWRVVESVCPGHKAARRALRERGHLIPDL